MGRLQAQADRDFRLPFRLAEGTAALHARAQRFQFLLVFGLIHSLKPIRWHIDRPRRQQQAGVLRVITHTCARGKLAL